MKKTVFMPLSIIVPAYREGEESAHRLHALARHAMVSEMVVAAVDCSPGFNRVLNRVPKVRLLPSPRRGRGAQMNFGAGAAKGAWLLFLHADTRLEKGALEELSGVLFRQDLLGGAFRLKFDRPGWRYRLKAWGANRRSQILAMPYGDQGTFVRAVVFKDLGGFRNWPLFEDVDFFDRLKKRGNWVLLGAHAVTSARRWEKQGYWKATLKNALWIILFRLGVSPHWLSKHY